MKQNKTVYFYKHLVRREEASRAHGGAWCIVAYWEERDRVGDLFPVIDGDSIRIIGSSNPYTTSSSKATPVKKKARQDGNEGFPCLRLKDLFHCNVNPSEKTLRVRKKIGPGVY